MDVEQPSYYKLMTPSGMGLLVCGAGSHPSSGVQWGMCQRGTAITSPCSAHQFSFKAHCQLEFRNSVKFMVRRRARGKVPSSIQVDHGDVLVMDGLAQSEYEHCTASELQGLGLTLPTVGVAQHTASCPLAGVVGCVEASSQWSASILLGGALPLAGSVPAGLGDGVGHCHDVANLPGKCLFMSLFFYW